MKKILFFHHGSISVGAGLCALHLLANMARDSYELVACLPKQKGDLKEKIEELGIRVRTDIPKSYSYMHINGFHWNFLSPWHIKNVIDVKSYEKIVRRVIEEEQPDIVMVNSMTLFWIGRIARKNGAKTICFHRETYCKGAFGLRTAFIKNRLNRDFDKIVFISNYDLGQTGQEKEKYLRITDKVDASLYRELDKEACRQQLELPAGKLVLFTGGASKLKGIYVLLKAARLIKTDAKIVVLQCEKPSDQKEVRGVKQWMKHLLGVDSAADVWDYITRHGLENRFVLQGRTDCVEKYFAACDLIVFPSQSAHQARPIYEAGFAKRPIIVSDFPNTAEYLTQENGWVVRHKDASGWARCIDTVLQDEAAAREKVEKNYEKCLRENNLCDLRRELENLLQQME